MAGTSDSKDLAVYAPPIEGELVNKGCGVRVIPDDYKYQSDEDIWENELKQQSLSEFEATLRAMHQNRPIWLECLVKKPKGFLGSSYTGTQVLWMWGTSLALGSIVGILLR